VRGSKVRGFKVAAVAIIAGKKFLAKFNIGTIVSTLILAARMATGRAVRRTPL
jgi:hypothetical protein